MGAFGSKRGRRLAVSSIVAVVLSFGIASDAFGDGVGLVTVNKSIPASTVAVIDPESGTSSGGSSTDIRLAVGDVISFRFTFFPVPQQQIQGINGWITEYVPPNLQVIGVRLIDENGLTVVPQLPGLAENGTVVAANSWAGIPCSGGTCPPPDGGIAQLYHDTGIFYSTDLRTRRNPSNAFITLSNGIMVPSPAAIGSDSNLRAAIGVQPPFYAHNQWDAVQVRRFGIVTGNTPHLFGSPVAGALTHYRYESTEMGGTPGLHYQTGPWNRIQYPGSLIATGGPATSRNGDGMGRYAADASLMGWDLTPNNALPMTTRALRIATGAVRGGRPVEVEVTFRVLGTPIDPGFGLMGGNVNCGEAFGGHISGSPSGGDASTNPWSLFAPTPGCVFLNLLFEINSDELVRDNAEGQDDMTFTIRARNLSLNPRTNVWVRQKYNPMRLSLSDDAGRPPFPDGAPTCTISSCDGDGYACLYWSVGTLDPSEEIAIRTRLEVSNGGDPTTPVRADFTSNDLGVVTGNPCAGGSITPGFITQETVQIRSLGVLDANLTTTTPSVPTTGGTASISGTLSVAGTQGLTANDFWLTLPTGWRATSINVGGTSFACSSLCATNTPRFDGVNRSMPDDSSVSLAFNVTVPSGTAAGNHPIDLHVVTGQTGYGGRKEFVFNDVTVVPVGGIRSDAPVLACPIVSTQTSIPGTITEANGTIIRVYFNGIPRSRATASGGAFNATAGPAGTGVWAGPTGTFGSLWGGLEVRATAQAPGENESPLSAACFVTAVSVCGDGFDNDGDGLVDYPADPGCSSLGDSDETNVQCSDGIDNDSDGNIDFPADPECASPDDTTEGGPAACNNGIDDDGDGTTDVADPCCTTSTDRSETCFRQCNDRLDNDADALIDFMPDPGCHAMNDDQELDLPDSGDINARLLVVFDTSGSMNWNTCTSDFTGGDGTLECPGNDVACMACGAVGCGDSTANDSRIDKAKRGLYNSVAAYGEVEWGLMRFHQRAASFSCPTSNATAQSGGWIGAGADPCGGGFNAGDLIVGFDTENQYDLLEWVDGSSNYPGGTPPAGMDFELRGTGSTPLAGSLMSAQSVLTAERAADTVAACRPYRVILITDGIESCGGNPSAAASALLAAGFRVHVIGFAVANPTDRMSLNSIASSGGTGSAIFVDDDTALSTAISDIVADTVLVESCNNLDDDCDTLIDEGFAKYCNRPAGVTTSTLCGDPGETVCDGMDDNCNGLTDEGLLNACGVCGPTPGEVCDRIDNDCDGAVDEGGVCICPLPSPEVCDNVDNDCDTRIDEGLTRSCGTDVGACTSGLETCTLGVWGGCTGTGPFTEVCDNADNDCDGVIDGITRPCGTDTGVCATGLETCTAGAWGMCTGGIGPGTEVCNTLDDDCDSSVDEGNPGGGGTCGGAVGECTAGTLNCTMGMLVCTGGTGPTMELCDTLDNDCDSLVDEGNPGGGAACGATNVGECDFGSLTCMGGTLVCTGERGPTMELCDGLDNDCDTMIDEGDPEAGAPCGDDTGECMEGITRCIGGMLTCEGGVGPVPEVCNALDDDCDGVVDDGIPVGAPCGTDTGECVPGLNICRDGMIVCEGGIDPIAEECDALDNDCDGRVDEGLGAGAACGMDEGLCMAGMIQCIGGRERCVGEVPPSREACDCSDNDCDGTVDEAPMVGTLCPAGSECIDCQCARPCVVDEFRPPCPTGSIPVMRGDECWCVAPACDPVECATQTVEVDGVVQCAPDSSGVPACVCKENECTYPCSGVVCEDGFVCAEGMCVPDMCPFTACPDGEICDPVAGTCYADPCVGAGCAADEACRLGTCETSCADVTCSSGERCEAGVCVTNLCDGVSCASREVCNPEDGTCTEDMCVGRVCTAGTVCDPVTGSCEPDPCIPLHCPGEEVCIAGECAPSGTMPDAGVDSDGGPVVRDDAGPGGFDAGHDPEFRILATGGGGCSCNVPGRDTGGGDEPWWAVLFVVAAVILRLRRRSR